MRKWLTHIVLLLLIGGLVAISVLEPGKEKAKPKPKLLDRFDRDSVRTISIHRADTIQFERRDGRWWITSPLKAPANEFQLDRILDLPNTEIQTRYPLPQDQLAVFGLDQPKAVVGLGDLPSLSFGGTEPIDLRRYVRVGNETQVALVNDTFFYFLTAPASEYVDKKLLPLDQAMIRSLEIGELKVKRQPDGGFDIQPPAAASAAVISPWFDEWQRARAIDLKPYTGSGEGLENIRLTLANGEELRFLVVQKSPELILARPDWALEYHFTADAGQRLMTPPEPPAAPTSPSANPSAAPAGPAPTEAPQP